MLQRATCEDKQPGCGWDVGRPQDYSIKEVIQAHADVNETE
jgi:hypothetical protein